MNQSIIAAAVAAAVVAVPAANAGVQIYGQVHVSIDMLDRDGFSSEDQWNVMSRSSRIGFKGTEDLGNGMSLIWKAETGYDFADGSAWGSSGRNAYIGLAGDWGAFLYGRHDSPYKMAWYSTGVDMLGDTLADGNAMSGAAENRFSNAIAYVSPNMNGLTFAAATVPGEGGGEGGSETGLADGYAFAAMYSNNGLKLAAGKEDATDVTSTDNDDRWFFGAGFTMDAFTIAANYVDDSKNYDGGKKKSINVAGSYAFGNNKLIATYAKDDHEWISDEDGWAIGLTHALSKRTTAYAVYATSDDDSGQTDNLNAEENSSSGFSLGMIHNF
ncbi:porin [Solemya elarraichensis gill symbiont]|uniref:Porin domain-containing protein n=1 Tax=Solemya elarraichensis gill symbiont TaxID=1918949 RepID=A0A1T2KZI4_9GAMM|nr:porin [Solemya elarraichensis gill symbiont]OOZ38231.1 hypothetical protein BOW52_08995 [Solemya elarraichensis gill symbiont]